MTRSMCSSRPEPGWTSALGPRLAVARAALLQDNTIYFFKFHAQGCTLCEHPQEDSLPYRASTLICFGRVIMWGHGTLYQSEHSCGAAG